jgi:hypothetical protein
MGRGAWRLDQWAVDAPQADRNAACEALFSIVDGSVFGRFSIVDDASRGREFFVIVRPHLVLKVSITHFNAFGLLYIGTPQGAPGLAAVVSATAAQGKPTAG